MRRTARGSRRCGSASLLVGALAALASPSVGCTSAEPRPVREALADHPRRALPLARGLVLAPIERLDRAAQAGLLDDGQGWRPVAGSLEALDRALVEAAEAAGAAEVIGVLPPARPRPAAAQGDRPPPAGSAAASEPAAAPDGARPLKTLLALTREEGCDLLLRARLRRHAVRFRGLNGHFVTFALVFVNVWLPAYWVADERYAAEVEVEVELFEAKSGDRLLRRIYRAEGEVELDTFDRGWNFFGSFCAPETLDDDGWERVGAHALPHAYLDLAKKLAKDLHVFERATR